MLLRDVEVDGRRVDVRIAAGQVAEIAARLPGSAHLDGRGGALLPGLHDHHVHVLAIAAAAGSLDLTGAADLTALRSAEPGGGWVRAVGYDEATAGPLDRELLDWARADVPVRVQHRIGALWVLNSAALSALEAGADSPLERDATGQPTGRLWRADGWLRDRLADRGRPAPRLDELGRRVARLGVTGLTDATPDLDAAAVGLLAAAHCDGALPQRLMLLANPAPETSEAIAVGPAKIVVADHALPSLADLVASIRQVRRRPVAVHCVTRAALLLTLAALDEAGVVPGDRIEHAALVAPGEASRLAALGVRVVTQPALPAVRGDVYLRDSEAADRPLLWPYGSLLRAGVRVGASSDAPYGDLDPWAAMRFAVRRRTATGQDIGPDERVDAVTALGGWLGRADDPGGPPRRVRIGAPADLVLLDVPLRAALADLDAGHVRATLIGGILR